MIMRKCTNHILFVIGLSISAASLAADTGFYIGGGLGQARASFDSTPAVAAGFPVTFDNSSYAYKIFGGYQINQYFSAEVSYLHLGEYTVQVVVPGIGGLFTTTDIVGWGGALVGALPLANNFSLLGKAGAAYLRETRGNCNICANPVSSSSDNVWSPTFGIGLKYDFNPNLSARAEAERFTKIGSNDNTFGGHATLYTVGLGYKF